MEKKQASTAGTSRRAFLSATAATAVAAPVLIHVDSARADSGLPRRPVDRELRKMLREVDSDRIGANILRLTQFGTRHTASSQTDPVRGIGAVWLDAVCLVPN